MKVNSFDNSILTPEKKNQNAERPTRFSPTNEQKNTMTVMEKVHKFLYHSEVSYYHLEMMNLTSDSISEIQSFFNEIDPDIMDILMKKEEKAIAEKEFTVKIKNYISEEFNIPADYSFATICILSFSDLHNFGVVKSGKYLFGLNSTSFACLECSGVEPEDSEKVKSLKVHNLQVLKEIQNQTLLDNSQDDSDRDEEYKPVIDAVDTLSDLDSSESETLPRDVFKFQEDETETDSDIYNPFDKTRTTRSDLLLVNSTFRSGANWFCLFKECDKNFSKLYNLKLHLISQHKVFPRGMSIYQCPQSGCNFACGNLVLFNRHNHSKSDGKKLARIKCAFCDETFAGKSSIARHVKRKHPGI